MSINSVKFSLGSIQPLEKPMGEAMPANQSGKTEKVSFGDIMKEAVSEVNGLQLEAENQIEGLVLGKEGITTHDAMIALEKADVAFQLMNTIRGRIVRAYEEVMRTQV